MEGDRYGRFTGGSTQDAVDIEATTEGGEWSAEVLREAGFYPIRVIGERGPGLESRYSLVEDADGGHIEHRFVQPPQPPRSLSKVKLMRALKAKEIWLPVKAFIAASEDYADEWELSTTLDEDNELIVSAVAALKAQLGLTDEQVEEILSASVAD